MRKLIAALAIGALPAMAAVPISLLSAAPAHANCVSSTFDGKNTVTRQCNLTPQQANAQKDQIRDTGGQASGSQTAYGLGTNPKH